MRDNVILFEEDILLLSSSNPPQAAIPGHLYPELPRHLIDPFLDHRMREDNLGECDSS